MIEAVNKGEKQNHNLSPIIGQVMRKDVQLLCILKQNGADGGRDI
jgi:hypothetical protein